MSGEACQACGSKLATRNYVDYKCSCGARYLRVGAMLVEHLDPDTETNTAALPETGAGFTCGCGHELVSDDHVEYACLACKRAYWRRGGEIVAENGDVAHELPRAIVVERD